MEHNSLTPPLVLPVWNLTKILQLEEEQRNRTRMEDESPNSLAPFASVYCGVLIFFLLWIVYNHYTNNSQRLVVNLLSTFQSVFRVIFCCMLEETSSTSSSTTSRVQDQEPVVVALPARRSRLSQRYFKTDLPPPYDEPPPYNVAMALTEAPVITDQPADVIKENGRL